MSVVWRGGIGRAAARGVLTALVVSSLGCGAPPDSGPAATLPETEAHGGFPRTIADASGRSLTLAARPERIVSQTLATDEILFDLLGAESVQAGRRPGLDRLVGVSPFARDPAYSNVAALAAAHPAPAVQSAEEVLRLRPDLVFVASYSRAEVVELLGASGAPVYRFTGFDTFDDISANILRVGAAVGAEAPAAELVERMKARLAAVEVRRRGRPRPRVLSYSPGGASAGRGTMFDDIVRWAGGVNEAAARGIDGFPKLSAEQVLAWDPDVLVAGYLDGERDSVEQRLRANPAIAATRAARSNRIVYIHSRSLLAVSHHVAGAVEALADALDRLESQP